jgi:hypothetical protein
MRLAPVVLLLAAWACAISPDRPRFEIPRRPFHGSLAFDPASFQMHGACGRGRTTASSRPREVAVTANTGTWLLSPYGAAAAFEFRNTLGNNPFGDAWGGAHLPATITWSPAISGNYEFRAVIAATDSMPEVRLGPEPYSVPLHVALKVQAGSVPGTIEATASAHSNSGAPTTYAYSFCVRSRDGGADDVWRPGPPSPDPIWQVTPPEPGPWLVYVSAFALQQGYTEWAAVGEQIAVFP